MSTQFKHIRDPFILEKGGATIAVNIDSVDLSKLDIDTLVDSIQVGMSVCSGKDSFNKKIGRELAVSRLKPTTLRVIRISKSRLDNGQINTKVILESSSFYISFTRSSESANFRLDSVVLTS